MKTRLAARNEELPAGVDEARAFRLAMKIAPCGAKMKYVGDRQSRGVKRKRNSEHGGPVLSSAQLSVTAVFNGVPILFPTYPEVSFARCADSLHAPAIGLVALNRAFR